MCVTAQQKINLVSVRTTHFLLVNLVCVECHLISVREETPTLCLCKVLFNLCYGATLARVYVACASVTMN